MVCAVRQRRVEWLKSVQTPQLHRGLCPANETRMAVPSLDNMWLSEGIVWLSDQDSRAQPHLIWSLSILL